MQQSMQLGKGMRLPLQTIIASPDLVHGVIQSLVFFIVLITYSVHSGQTLLT